jgi:hypothetical protein
MSCNSDSRGQLREEDGPEAGYFGGGVSRGGGGDHSQGFSVLRGVSGTKEPGLRLGVGGVLHLEKGGAGQGLRGPCMIELMGQAAAQAAGFSEDFFAG